MTAIRRARPAALSPGKRLRLALYDRAIRGLTAEGIAAAILAAAPKPHSGPCLPGCVRCACHAQAQSDAAIARKAGGGKS